MLPKELLSSIRARPPVALFSMHLDHTSNSPHGRLAAGQSLAVLLRCHSQ
jgi:hypothetical protein